MKDISTIEKMLVNHGRIIDHQTFSSYFTHLSNINNKISSLIKKGWLVSLKKGTYYITKLGSLGYATVSSYFIANIIGKKSFVSFEGALKYHGMFNQGLKKYRSISAKQYLSKKLEGITYNYIAVSKKDYFGFNKEKLDENMIRIASKERALLDLIEYQRTIYSVSLVIEIFQNHKGDIDLNLLAKYLKRYSQVTIKTIGLILDWLEIDSTLTLKLITSKASTSKLLDTSDKFNNKWRLYYDSILGKQIV